VPRDSDGNNWDVRFFTSDKEEEGWAIVDWVATPFPDTTTQDGPVP
jgi:hypothetical protein